MAFPVTEPNCIYCIRCNANGRVYIGRTKNLEQRIRQHLSELRRGYKKEMRNPLFQEDFDKYGEESFSYYVLERDVSPGDVVDRENYWINKYKSNRRQYGYNDLGGDRSITLQFSDGAPPLPDAN